MKFLPWFLSAALLVIIGLLYSSNQKKDSDLAQVRAEAEQARATPAETNQAPAPLASDELTRLREENKDVLRLRNEIRQMREQNQQLSRQAETAQAQVQSVQAQAEATRNNAAQALAQAQQLQNSSRTQAQLNACINNLRQIDGAIQQWALENRQPATARVTPADVVRYLGGVMPVCPAGGVYTLNTVSTPPTCSVPGHVLPKGQ